MPENNRSVKCLTGIDGDRIIEYHRDRGWGRRTEDRRGRDRDRSVEDRRDRDRDRSVEDRRGRDRDRSVEDRRDRGWGRRTEDRRGRDRDRSVEDRRDYMKDFFNNSKDSIWKITEDQKTKNNNFINNNNNPIMIADPLDDYIHDNNIHIDDLYPTSSNSGRFFNKGTKRESLISADQTLPNHATTLGIKVEDISGYNLNNHASKKTPLKSYIFKHNFASSKPFINNPEINNDRNIYTRHPYPEKGDKETPRNDSEIAALQKLTNLVDPLKTLQALNNGEYKYDGFDSDLENFKGSALYNLINYSQAKSKKSRIKIYMQNSHWYPCNKDWDAIQGGGDRSGKWCHNYLDQTIEFLNKNYGDKVDFRLKVLNYGDKNSGESSRITRFGTSVNRRGLSYADKSKDNEYQEKDRTFLGKFRKKLRQIYK